VSKTNPYNRRTYHLTTYVILSSEREAQLSSTANGHELLFCTQLRAVSLVCRAAPMLSQFDQHHNGWIVDQ
jgi:hypothetical protein